MKKREATGCSVVTAETNDRLLLLLPALFPTATLAVKLHVPLDRHKVNSKGACDLCLSRLAIDHQLACEHPKARQAPLLVHKNRYSPVDIVPLPSLPLHAVLP